MKKLTEKQIRHIKQKINLNSELFLIRIEVTNDKEVASSRNIYCINKDFEILWQIKANSRLSSDLDNPFYNIESKNGKVFATDWFGYTYEVNEKTGHVTVISWGK